jgi:hypothetical protein
MAIGKPNINPIGSNRLNRGDEHIAGEKRRILVKTLGLALRTAATAPERLRAQRKAASVMPAQRQQRPPFRHSDFTRRFNMGHHTADIEDDAWPKPAIKCLERDDFKQKQSRRSKVFFF